MIKRCVRSLAKLGGWEILGRHEAFAAERSIIALIQQERINLVIDVGANDGGFVGELRSWGYRGRVISFEPLEVAHSRLKKRAESDPNWVIADRTAVGAVFGIVEMHVSGTSVSSSILEMLPLHLEAGPQSSYVGTETVQVHPLDHLCPLNSTDRVLLKVDVQGYESQVLAGALRVLEGCRAVMSEMSLVPLYDGQASARDIWDLLKAQGFVLWSLEPGFRNPRTGQVLQFDGIFVRTGTED